MDPNRTRTWKDLDLWFLCRGRGQVITPNGKYELKPGSCMVMRGGDPYTFSCDFEYPFENYWIHFDCLDVDGKPVSPEVAEVPQCFRQIKKHDFIEMMLARLVEAFDNGDAGRQEIWLLAILTELYRTDKCDDSSQGLSERQIIINEICRLIDQNPQLNWTITRLSKKYCGCRSGLYRAFTAQTGLSPQQYVINARMRKARELLTESANDINWIAETLGYRDVFFFSRQFKHFHGISPTKYRNRK